MVSRLAQAVFKGGGVMGIGLVGGLSVAEANGWRWKAVAGTSAGSIVAALVGAGYRSDEVHQIIFDLDFKKFEDGNFKLINFLMNEGLYKGQYVVNLMDQLMGEKLGKAEVTFRDLPIPTKMVASDLTHRRMLVFPDDLAHAPYNLPDPLSFPVSHAVRASISIPFFFEPYRMVLPGGTKATLVDGGLLSNFPVELFEPLGKPAMVPTFGFNLYSPGSATVQETDTPMEMVSAMLNTMLGARDKWALEEQNYARAINIDTGIYHTTQFDIDEAGKAWLYESGQRAAKEFFADPAIQDWLKRFPSRVPSRAIAVDPAKRI